VRGGGTERQTSKGRVKKEVKKEKDHESV